MVFFRVDTQPNGNPVAVKTDGTIWIYNGFSWSQMPGCAKDIGVGLSGLIVVIGCNVVPGGYGVYTYNNGANSWTGITGGAVKVDVGPDGQIWVVNSLGQIFFTTNRNNWTMISGWASDISVSNNNVPVCIGSSQTIWRWRINQWLQLTGSAVTISVGPYDEPWVTNAAGQVYSTTRAPF